MFLIVVLFNCTILDFGKDMRHIFLFLAFVVKGLKYLCWGRYWLLSEMSFYYFKEISINDN